MYIIMARFCAHGPNAIRP